MSDTFNAADGRSIVAADNAETIGEVKGFVVDPTATMIESVHVSGRGRRAEVIPWSKIRSFGPDAVLAQHAEDPEHVAKGRDTDAVKGKIIARGSRILDTNGFERGTVEDVMFDSATGRLTGVLSTQGQLSAASLRSLGSYALIVDPE